jgi:hypothetical protein
MFTNGVDSIAAFLTRYRSFDEAQQQQSFEEFTSRFEGLQVELVRLQMQAAAGRRQTAETFNNFQVLGVAGNEVRTHSALLADLLNPHGSHAQGTLFLASFLRRHSYAFAGTPTLPDPLPHHGWSVRKELNTPHGNLDLVVGSSQLGYLCVIENKLGAGEQIDQLARYYRWLGGQHYPHRALFYLTPDGRPSQTHNGAVYCPLSYRDDVIPWLEEVLPEVEAPRVAETLKQYVDVLRGL